MFRIVCFIILFTPLFGKPQTCILLLKTKNAIYAGADGKVTITGVYGTGADSNSHDVDCKIHNEGDHYFATAGIEPELTTEYARMSCKKAKASDKVSVIAISFFNAIQPSLTKDIQRIRDTNTDSYEKRFGNGRYACQISFFQFNNDGPGLVTIDIFTKINHASRVEVIYDLDSGIGPILGLKNAIDKFKQTTEFGKLPPEKQIYKLIELECDDRDDSASVGRPIYVLILTKNMRRWYPQKPDCY